MHGGEQMKRYESEIQEKNVMSARTIIRQNWPFEIDEAWTLGFLIQDLCCVEKKIKQAKQDDPQDVRAQNYRTWK